MSNLFKKYETDKKKETQGVEITIDGNVFITRRAGGGNRAYRAALGLAANARDDFQEKINSPDMAVKLAIDDDVTIEAFAEAVVIGWYVPNPENPDDKSKGIEGRDGQPMEFTKANFLDLMKACPDVWFELKNASFDLDNFRILQVKETGEELGKS